MKLKIIFLIGLITSLATSCVDDYSDYNARPFKDAPTFRVSSTGSDQLLVQTPVNQYQTNPSAYLKYGTSVEYTVSVIDAPGLVNGVSVTPSIPDFGSVQINENSVQALKGKEKGEFKFTFTPTPGLSTTTDRSLNIDITVFDSQVDEDGESNPRATVITMPVTIFTGCVSTGITPGFYLVTEASGNLDGNVPFTLGDIETDGGTKVTVEVVRDRPGLYTFKEVTGGVWPLYYSGRARPDLKINLCGSTITGRAGAVTAGAGTAAARTFTLNGSLNSDGSINMQWSYVRDDGATPAGPAKGTYKLVRL